MKTSKNEIQRSLGLIDIFVCASGFEDRTLALAMKLDKKFVRKSIVFNPSDNYAASYDNIEKISSLLDRLDVVEYPKNSAIETFDILYNSLSVFIKLENGNKLRMVVDISTFTREVLLILIKILSLKEFQNTFQINLSYTPAESYQTDWLTKGVRQIRSIFGFSGMTYPSKRLLLIVLNGFETERTEEIINSFEANKILIGKPNQKDSINNGLNLQSNEKFQFIKEKYCSIILEDFEFSCTDVYETQSILEDLIKKYSQQFNIVIAPLNNKISTLATALVGLKDDSIQICYASANQYNIHLYSESCDYFLVYDFNDMVLKNQE